MSGDAATVAAVLAEHRAVVSGDDDGWHVVCSCGHNELSDDPLPHVAAALLAAPPIAQALAAVEAVARVEALAESWERTANECERLSHVRAGLSDERDLFNAALINRRRAEDLRAALNPRADQ